MTTIYCDEAGNTGANLLDPLQPFFVLATNNFSEEEAIKLLEHVRSAQGAESKFSTLRRRPEGIARLIRFISDPGLNKERVCFSVYHKRYMIVTKLVDLIAETLIHSIGGNLYERGGNIAMANMLYYCIPAFCGQTTTDNFLQAFVNLIRYGSEETKEFFYVIGKQLVDASVNDRFKEDLVYFTEPSLYESWYHGFDWSDLDPAIPALFHQMVVWSERTPTRFHVVHDRSKPILASADTFELMMAGPGEESKTIGTDRRKITFPLRATSLSQGDSAALPQLQVADLCAGAINHFYKLHINGQSDDLSKAVEVSGCLGWGRDFILPQPHFTPEALGTDGSGGSDSVEEMISYIVRKELTQY